MQKIIDHLAFITPDIIEIRRQLHRIPELKYEEFKTAALIQKTLESYGYHVQNGIAHTGLCAILDSGKPGKTIALRADMDALPLNEPSNNPDCSVHAGKMHACGHDGHCATLLMTAYALYQIKDQLCGRVKFIFQPAEEGGKGSTAMIEAGILNDVDEIYGYHNWPGLAEGMIATRPGSILKGNGRIELTIHGKSAHTAQPEHAINPVTIGAHLITAIDNLKSHALVNIIAANSGDYKNGMAEKSEIIAIYYAVTDEELTYLKNTISEIYTQLEKKYMTKIDVTYKAFHTPTINSSNEAQLVIATARHLYGESQVLIPEKSMVASEDFSEYLRHVPGCFFLVGTGKTANMVHTPDFQFNDKIISIAANVFCHTVIKSQSK